MKSSRRISTVLVFLAIVIVALTFSPKAVADTVLSESANDWSIVPQPDTSGDNYRWLFYGRLKPGNEYDSIKNWSESSALSSDFNESNFLIDFAEEKILGGMVISVGLGIIRSNSDSPALQFSPKRGCGDGWRVDQMCDIRLHAD